jgi:AcrR family transcriptional regulator
MASPENLDPAHRGRPRDPALEPRVLRAALDLIAERGLAGATIDAVAERSGVARATIYRRWAGRDALIEAAIRHAIGRNPIEPSGDLVADIRRGAEQTRRISNEPLFRAVFSEIVRELLRPSSDGDQDGAQVTYDGLFPGRRRVAEAYGALAGATGFRTDIDPYLAVDLVIGAQVNHLLATGASASRALVDDIVDVVLAGLRVAGD